MTVKLCVERPLLPEVNHAPGGIYSSAARSAILAARKRQLLAVSAAKKSPIQLEQHRRRHRLQQMLQQKYLNKAEEKEEKVSDNKAEDSLNTPANDGQAKKATATPAGVGIGAFITIMLHAINCR